MLFAPQNSIYHEKSPFKNTRDDFSKAYTEEARVVELQTVAYYLGLASRQNSKTPIYALYRDDLFHGAVEVLEGIADFQVEYFLKTKEFAGEYRKADAIPLQEWSNILGIRIKVKTSENKNWEYEFAIRNRHCISVNFGFVDPHCPLVGALDDFGDWNYENNHLISNTIADIYRA